MEADTAEHFTSSQPGIGRKENQVTILNGERLLKGLLFLLTEELDDRRLPLSALHLDVSQALGALTDRQLGQRFHLTLCHISQTFGIECFDHPALFERTTEYLEGTLGKSITEIMDLKTKASIRLIDAIRVHGFFKSDTTKVFRNGQTKGRPPDMPHEALNETIDVLSVNEGHFDVHLGKFRLAIGTQVLITVAACQLEVFFHA